MTRHDVYQELTTVFQDVFDVDTLHLTDSTTARDVEGWDSLAHVNLVLSIEQQFGVKFKTSEIAQLSNVGEMVDLILAKNYSPSPTS